jgi:hypothetical protein
MNAQQRNLQGYDGSFFGLGDKIEVAPQLEKSGFGRVVEILDVDKVRIALDDVPNKHYAVPVDKLRFVREH